MSTCSDSQAALKALKAIRTISPLAHHCQTVLNDICTQHVVGQYWIPGHAGVWGNEITDELARSGSALRFLGPELALGVSRQDIQKRLGCWLVNQQQAKWWGLGDTQRQAQELILGPSLTFNRIQSRAATGLLMGHNTLRRHLYLLGLLDSPLCRRWWVGEKTSVHILCECNALASLRNAYLGSFFLQP